MWRDRTRAGRINILWWTVDRWLLAGFLSLLVVGSVLVLASSPPVARRIGMEPYHFVIRQWVFVLLSFITMLWFATLERRTIRRLASIGLLGTLVIMALLPVLGMDAKGATRWLKLGPLSLQPSEFMKPCFVIVVAWVLSERQQIPGFPGYRIASGLYVFAALLLLLQPDIGMLMVLTSIFAVQLFLSGIPMLWVLLIGVVGIAILIGAYHWFPHVADRINGFLDPSSTDNYQVNKSLEAFASGGLIGQGPGAGDVKWSLPDAHTDFVYAVIGEEFGLFIALITIMMFAALVLRGFYKAAQVQELFPMLAVTGLVAQFGLQAFINMGVAVHLLPAKGMTLPFLSYGGSSLLAMAMTAGCILGLTRRKFGSLTHTTPYHWSATS